MREAIITLSPRQREIALSIWQGYNNKETAQRLGISSKTVESHRATLHLKMRTNNTAQLIQQLLKQGIVKGKP